MLRSTILRACVAALACNAHIALAADEEPWNAHFQATYVFQQKPGFPAAYSGPNSLRAGQERSYTFSATAYLGWRPWRGGELYFNPEAVQGVPLSGVTGLGGPTNGEIQKAVGRQLTLYNARLFLRQTWSLGEETEQLGSDQNQLAGRVARDRVVLTVGSLATSDVFGVNEYASDARTRFLNWSFLTFGAYDYAANLRGYTIGAALEYLKGDWALRGGRFMQPKESNGQQLDHRIFTVYGDQAELERRHSLGGRPGKVQLLGYRNVARMAAFSDALDAAAASGTTPDINTVRRVQAKVGFGAAVEQQIAGDAGVFLRYSAHDGRTETYAFTEIDRSLIAGVLVPGARWGRPADQVGLAFARNEISASHRQYLGAGGTTFFLGDGAIDYRPETIAETFYSFGVARGTSLSIGWQHIENPAYNAARGPVDVASFRVHAEF